MFEKDLDTGQAQVAMLLAALMLRQLGAGVALRATVCMWMWHL